MWTIYAETSGSAHGARTGSCRSTRSRSPMCAPSSAILDADMFLSRTMVHDDVMEQATGRGVLMLKRYGEAVGSPRHETS